ncbi:MAG: ABC transporter permease [Butyrivibrio sp.]|nr:ABC transporter permease [Butyrivibrio sp.]
MRFIKRNILMYYRDRAGVFFSFLTTIIILILMIAFLGEANVISTLNVLGVGADNERLHALCLIIKWTVAGIIVVNAVTISMTMIGFMVRDEESHKLDAFLVAPVKSSVYVAGYIIAASFVSFTMCILTFALGEIYIRYIGGVTASFKEIAAVVVVIFSIIFSTASFVFLCAGFVRTNSAYVGITSIISSIIGFLAAIYIPYGGMPGWLRNIIRFVPAFQGSSALREILLTKDISWFSCDNMHKEGFSEYMGLVIQLNNKTVPVIGKITYMILFGVVLMFVATYVMTHRSRMDR